MINFSNNDLASLVDAIKEKTGLDFSNYGEKSLNRRMVKAFISLNLNSTEELWYNLKRDERFIHKLVNILSVGLTTMFRDTELWVRLRQELTEMTERKKKVRVWHAGCSTGEEVYSLNIILEELGIRENFKSVATDMNEESLDKAKNGIYGDEIINEYDQQYTLYKRRGSLDK